MAFDAKVLEILILIPEGMNAERETVEGLLANWNAERGPRQGLILLSRRWTAAEKTAESDLLIGCFQAIFGATVEDDEVAMEVVRRHHAAHRPAVLGFSRQAAASEYVPEGQTRLKHFKRWAQDEGLAEIFDGAHDLARLLALRLPQRLDDSRHIRALTDADFAGAFDDGLGGAPRLLGQDAGELLLKAAAAPAARLTVHAHADGADVVAGVLNFTKNQTAREVTRWLGAVQELFNKGLVADVSGRGEIFCITHAGFLAVDQITRLALTERLR